MRQPESARPLSESLTNLIAPDIEIVAFEP
jgi:hypothetical protein